jgi:hypothetical protein
MEAVIAETIERKANYWIQKKKISPLGMGMLSWSTGRDHLLPFI